MELQEHAAQLARLLERTERGAELGERALARFCLFVPGHLLRRFRVEDEACRRPLGPVAQTCFRGTHLSRIPLLQQAFVGPTASAEADDYHGAKDRGAGRAARSERATASSAR